jgi:organic radical activating enzyme
MPYAIKEIFDTIQGEGARAGTRAVFIRFAGCNLWSGREEDRGKGRGACAAWCDTDFVDGEKLSAQEIVARVEELWPRWTGRGVPPNQRWHRDRPKRWVVVTGGEPALQFDEALREALRAAGFSVAMETNGTCDRASVRLVDHLCVSPKLGSTLEVMRAHELKVVIPGVVPGIVPPQFERQVDEDGDLQWIESAKRLVLYRGRGWTDDALSALAAAGDWGRLYVSPQDGPDQQQNVLDAIALVQRMPEWALSLQQHKILGLR